MKPSLFRNRIFGNHGLGRSTWLLPWALLGSATLAFSGLAFSAVWFAAPLSADEPAVPPVPTADEPPVPSESPLAPDAPVCPTPPRPAPPAWDPSKDVKIRLGPDGKPLEIAPLDPAGHVPSSVKPLPPAQPEPSPPPADDLVPPPAMEPADPAATPNLPGGPAPAPTPAPVPAPVPAPETAAPAPGDPWLPGAVDPAPPTGPLPEPHAGAGEPPWPGATGLPGIVVWPPEGPPQGGIAPILPRPLTRPEDWPGVVLPPEPPAPSPPAAPPVMDDPWLPGATLPPMPALSPSPSAPEPPLPEALLPEAPLPEAPQPEAPLPEAPLPPSGLVFPDPPAGTGDPVFEPPPGAQPRTNPQPATPAAPVPTPVPSSLPNGQEPDGFQFTPPDQKRAQAHADRLRATPTDASLKGYPADLVPRARAEIALDPASKPALVLFYDDGARASNLQAAELLPLLVRLRESIDVIPIDVAASSTLSAAEKKLVRTYYMAYVPTTVVLGANRKPILLQYQRVSAAVVEAAISAAPR